MNNPKITGSREFPGNSKTQLSILGDENRHPLLKSFKIHTPNSWRIFGKYCYSWNFCYLGKELLWVLGVSKALEAGGGLMLNFNNFILEQFIEKFFFSYLIINYLHFCWIK